MTSFSVFLLIFLVSFALAWVKFFSLDTSKFNHWQRFAEFWNCLINFLIPGIISYYFVLVRWPQIEGGNGLNISDFLLLGAFVMGLFGHLNVLSYNLTKGVEAILERLLNK